MDFLGWSQDEVIFCKMTVKDSPRMVVASRRRYLSNTTNFSVSDISYMTDSCSFGQVICLLYIVAMQVLQYCWFVHVERSRPHPVVSVSIWESTWEAISPVVACSFYKFTSVLLLNFVWLSLDKWWNLI